ncbi:MAG: hypothetical protein P8L19_03865, partial [Flavobacteriales bacterium]|nr:hypothetical protein [Flavobacteriales bacterium]
NLKLETSIMKRFVLILICLPMIGFGQVYIPDANFKAYLVGNTAINTNGDSEIQASEAVAFNGAIYCGSNNVSDLTGIEAFTALTALYCYGNQLTSIDVSNSIYLDAFSCINNLLTSLDVSANTALTILVCNSNQLTSLDLRNGNNNNLTWFSCDDNLSLNCINVDDVAWSTTNLWSIDPQHYFSTNCSPLSIQEQYSNKELLKASDLLGRETKKTNQLLFYIYDDGTVEKKIIID